MTRYTEAIELERDLASLSSQAAIELDDLLLGRSKNLVAVKALADKIADSLKSGQALDTTTAVAVHRALFETPGLPHSNTLNELLNSTTDLTGRLSTLVDKDGAEEPTDELKRLRSFCVALSRHATALLGSPYDRPDHPFRR